MSTVRWLGGATASAQVSSYAFGGTWEADDVVRVTLGAKTKDFTSGSTTTATVVSNLVAAWAALSATDYPEFADLTAAVGTAPTTFTLTAKIAGRPFTATLLPLEVGGGAADVQTIEGGTSATTGTATTAGGGPSDWNTPRNWSGDAVPVSGDDVVVDLGEWPILYGLSQAAVNLASLKVLVRDNGNWTLGLPEVNRDGGAYPEYRTQYLTLGACTVLDIRTTSGRIKINVGSAACTANVYETGRGPDEGTEAVLWKGTNAANVLNASGDTEVGVAILAGETASIATLRVEDNARVRTGSGVTLTNVTVTGGALECNSALPTLTARGGAVLHRAGALTLATLTNGAALDYRSAGTLGTLSLGAGSAVTFDSDPQARTVTNCDLYAGSSLSAENGTATFTNGIDLNQCALSDVVLLLPRHVRLTLGTPS